MALGAAAVVIAAGPASALLPRGTVRFVDVPVVMMPIVAAGTTASPVLAALAPARVPMLASPEPDLGGGPPVDVETELVESTPAGDVPRIAPDGGNSLQHYARPTTADCSRPCVAVLITGLGLADRLTVRALALPGPVGLSFSPYAGAASWQARARAAGHEALLMLPLEPLRFPQDDAGPLTVQPAIEARRAGEAVLRVLATGSGYVALDAAAGAFAQVPDKFAPVAGELRARGLGLIEIGGDALAVPARDAGLAYLATAVPVDLEPVLARIDRALEAVAAEALRSGRAVAVAQPLPLSFDRISAWLAGLPARGIQLVPPSRLLDGGGDAAVATRH